MLSYSIFEHHLQKKKSPFNYRYQENKKKRGREHLHVHDFVWFFGLWNENCLTNQKKLWSCRILFNMSNSIFDLFISFAWFSHFRVTPPKKSSCIKIQWQRNWWSKKPSNRTHKEMTKLVEWISKTWRKFHQLQSEFVCKWWWICHFIASFFF